MTLGRRAPLVAVLAVAAATRAANVWIAARLPVAEYQVRWEDGDMAASWTWAGRILAGDVLGRDTPHQYTSWMREWAPLSTWERWWGGREIFHQAPLYAYALAGMRFIGGDSFGWVAACQAVLGVANVALVYLLAARCFGGRAVPTLAGLGAALYGPFLLHETLFLRDGLGVTVSLLLLWWLAGCRDARPLPWLVGGALFALAVLAREATLVFAPFVAVWAVRRSGPRACLAFAAGAALGLAPLVVRNVAVGAPPLSLSTRGIEAFVYGNAADGSVVGLGLPAATRSILEQSDGRLPTAIRLTLATYDGDWGRLARNELAKLRAIFAAYEGMDNVDWYYFAERSPLLRWSLRFECVLALGLVGICLAPGRPPERRLLASFLVANVVALMFSIVVGRYRLPAVAVLLVYAGFTLAWTAREVRAGRWLRAAAAGIAVAGIAAASAHLLPADGCRRWRADEFLLAGEVHYRHGQGAAAFDEVRTGLATACDGPTLTTGYRNLALVLARLAHELGRDAESAAALERVAATHPADADVERILASVYRDALGRADEAERHFARARAIEGS